MFDFKNPHWRKRLAVMLAGIVIMGLGVCLFRLSIMGNDPSTALAIAFSDRIGLDLSIGLIIANSVYFVVEILLDRQIIGVGTFVNWFCVGFATTWWGNLLTSVFTMPESFAGRLIVMAAGVLVLSLSAALYQTADVGIAPYDALSIIMSKRLPIPYFWCRIATDSLCAVIAWLLGGIIGLGTLVCALGLGPFITFFSKTVAIPLCRDRRPQ